MPHRVRAAALACAGLWWPAAVVAQMGHPAPPEKRPRALHVRLAASDAVALGTVEAVDTGRIRVGAVRGLRGELQAALELKRAPSAPPPLETGDRALLLLRGARSPYLLVDEPEELWKLEQDTPEDALAQALREVDAARSQPEALAALYADWLGEDDIERARIAALGFEGDETVLAAAPAGTGTRLAAAALGSPDETLRGAALRAAVRQAASLRELLAGLPGAAADPEVALRALSAGLLREPEATRAAALRALGHDSPEMRAAVLRLGVVWSGDPALRESIARIASGDPDEQVRLAARRALAR